MSVFKKLLGFFVEEVKDEDENVKKNEVEEIVTTFIQPTEEETVVKEKKEVVKEEAAKPVNKEVKKEPTFLNIGPIESKPAETAKPASKPVKKETYRLQQVISPIYGSNQKDNYSLGSNKTIKESELGKESVIGTVCSPIYGKEVIKVYQDDEVDEDVANMQTADFISSANVQEAIKEEKKQIEEANKKIETQIAEIKAIVQEEPVVKKDPFASIANQEVIYPSEKEKDSNNQTYENLKLF